MVPVLGSSDEQPGERGRLARLHGLAGRDAELARLVAAGRSDADIASQLAQDVVDVRVALAKLLAQLGLRSRTELALLVAVEPEREA